MLLSLLLCLLVYCRAAPTDEEIKRKLIYEGSPDTFENRKLVKDILGSLNLRVRNLHRAGTGSGSTTTPPPLPDLGSKNNLTDLSAEAHPDLAEWLFEGDIALTPDQAKAIVRGQNEPQASRKKRAQTNPAGFWSPSYPIYYTLDSSLPSSTVSLIRQAIQFWTTNTCMNFQENPSGNNRLRFYRGTGCWSYIGKQPSWTSQDISIGSGCDILTSLLTEIHVKEWEIGEGHGVVPHSPEANPYSMRKLGTVAHEIGHALGFYHTQSRYDRDSYIWVNLDNVESGQEHNFVKQTTATENHFGLPYDYGSVMHYGGYAFARNSNAYTIRTIRSEYQNTIGQRERPAFSDVRLMNYLYNCSSLCTRYPVPACRSPGFQNPRNCYQCLCPHMFSGPTCSQLPTGTAPNCNGKVVQATSSSWVTLNGVAGNANSYTTTTTPTDCYWHISAPAGRRLEIKLSSPPKHCVQGCPWQGIEVNLGNFDQYGIIMCCPSTQTYTSTGNTVAIRGLVRYNQLNFGIDYRVI